MTFEEGRNREREKERNREQVIQRKEMREEKEKYLTQYLLFEKFCQSVVKSKYVFS